MPALDAAAPALRPVQSCSGAANEHPNAVAHGAVGGEGVHQARFTVRCNANAACHVGMCCDQYDSGSVCITPYP